MKLIEITSTITNKPTNLDMDDRNKPKRHGVGDDDIGHFSFVKPDEDDPHMIRKYHRRADIIDDAFNYYVEELRKRKLWNKNIHFPRIYNTNIHQGYKDWEIEKLIKLSDASKTEYRALIKRYFSGEDVDAGLYRATDKMNYMQIFLNFIVRYTGDGDGDGDEGFQVVDEELKKALNILVEIKRNVPEITHFDWGLDNIMFRRTSVGLQVVFTDPFGFAKVQKNVDNTPAV